ncbi:MAG: hypothetical protein AB1522_07280 [Chloroflexota bacterium]
MPSSKKNRFRDAKSGSAITISLRFNTKSSQIEKVLPDGTLQIGLTYSQDDPHVDEGLINFLSATFGVPHNRFEVIGNKTTNKRLVSIIGVSAEQVQAIVGKIVKIPA